VDVSAIPGPYSTSMYRQNKYWLRSQLVDHQHLPLFTLNDRETILSSLACMIESLDNAVIALSEAPDIPLVLLELGAMVEENGCSPGVFKLGLASGESTMVV